MEFRDMQEQGTFHAGREYERKILTKQVERIKELESFLQQLLWIAEKKPTDDSEDTTIELAEQFLKGQ